MLAKEEPQWCRAGFGYPAVQKNKISNFFSFDQGQQNSLLLKW